MSPRWTVLGLGAALVALAGCGGPAPKPEPAGASAPAPAPTAPAAPAAPAPPPPAIDTDAVLADGKAAAARGDLAGAEARFRQALTLDRGLAEAHYDLGVLAEWRGRADDARRHYRDALGARTDFGPAVIALGRLRLRAGDADGALELARRQLAQASDSPSLQNALNRLRLDADREVDRVEADSKAVLRDDEKNVPAMINLAWAYHDQGRHELAVAILKNARAIDPDDPEVLLRKALAHQALGEDLKARLALEEASRLPGGGSPEVHNNLGLVYHAAGDFVGAEAQFRKALARWPDMLAARINLGNALKGQQRFAEADTALQAALAQAPRDPDVLYNLGILYLDGQLPQMAAVARLERSLAFFERYKQTAGARPADDPIDEYIGEASKRIEVEQKRAAQQRSAPKAPPPQPASPPPAAAEPTPSPTPAAVPGDDPFEDEK